MKKNILLLSGDGIGPEVTLQAKIVLEAVAKKFNLDFTFEQALMGGCAIDATGTPLPAKTLEACKKSDAIILGAVGGPKWDALPSANRPEAGLLALRKECHLFANLRPARIYPELAELSCLRGDLVRNGIDLLVVRELTGDVYFGQPAGQELRNGVRYAYNNMIYNEEEIHRIAKVAFATAMTRNKKVCSVDKANVLAVGRLWRDVVNEVHQDYPEVELSYMYVDNCAMQLVLNPAQFDVILTGNIFGDILSDESAAIVGSLGMLPSASLSGTAEDGGLGLYEPVHGSAPDIAGQDIANPFACILSAALMLRISFGLNNAATAVENAVQDVLKQGYRTADIMQNNAQYTRIGCKQAGALIVERI